MHSLVLQSYGSEVQYRRAILLIMSFLGVVKDAISNYKILVFTDNIPFFERYLGGINIQYIFLDTQKISAYTGEMNFIHRMKIAIIEEAFNLNDGNLLYADTDSFFLCDPTPILNKLDPAQSYMHELEYPFSDLKDQSLPAGEESVEFYRNVISKDFLLTGDGHITVHEKMKSWNAGIMILHRNQRVLIPDIYKLTDQFFKLSGNHSSEQYAFSILLQERTNLQPMKEYSYHYWHRIQKKIVDEYIEKKIMLRINEYSYSLISGKSMFQYNNLPGIIERHPLYIQDKAIQALNVDNFSRGLYYSLQYLLKRPFSFKFIRDIGYHLKRRARNK